MKKPALSMMYGEDSDSEGDDDDEDTDIFAQATGSKKKQEEGLLKKKPVEAAPKPDEKELKREEPLKACLVIKLVDFNEEALAKKGYKELLKLEMDLEFNKKIVKCIASTNRVAFLIKEP